jgi:hypothetical protein
MAATTSLIIANLTTSSPHVDSFTVEVYSDIGLTTLIGSGSCAVVPDGSGNFIQAEGIVISGIPFGSTYYARAGVVAPVSGATTWSATYTGSTGANSAPATTYTHTFTPSVSGISVVATPVSAPTDTVSYDAIWVLDSSTPIAAAAPSWSGNVDGAGNLVFFAGAPPASVVRIFVRAYNTAYQYQAWTLLGSSTVPSVVTVIRKVVLVVDGGGAVPATGAVKRFIQVDFAGTVVGWAVFGDQSGSVTVDVWKKAGTAPPTATAPVIPTSSDKISASAPVTASAAQSASGGASAVSTWTTAVTAGDTFGFSIASITTFTAVTVELYIQQS